MTKEPTSRKEHLAWCKARALEYCDMGDPAQALASMTSDLAKHPQTASHDGVGLAYALVMAGHLSTPAEMREFIEGFQ